MDTHSLAERPDLVDAFWSVPGDWPTFMLQDQTSEPPARVGCTTSRRFPFVAHSTRHLIDARRPISPYARFMPDDRKTKPTDASADEVIAAVDDDSRRADADRAFALMREVTGVEPVVWGPSMIGFGTQPYTTADGKEREWFRVGLAPRKTALTLYGLTFYGSNEDLLERLGKHTLGKGCVYVKRMSDIDESVLRELIERSWSADD